MSGGQYLHVGARWRFTASSSGRQTHYRIEHVPDGGGPADLVSLTNEETGAQTMVTIKWLLDPEGTRPGHWTAIAAATAPEAQAA